MSGTTSTWKDFLESADIEGLTMFYGESYEEYEVHLQGLYEEFMPRGPTEDIQVLKLAQAIWSRKRVDPLCPVQDEQPADYS
jgi:hypothetical protein